MLSVVTFLTIIGHCREVSRLIAVPVVSVAVNYTWLMIIHITFSTVLAWFLVIKLQCPVSLMGWVGSAS